MREALRRTRTTTLALYVAACDAGVWLAALPFELYCRRVAETPGVPAWALIALLLANLALLAIIAGGAIATAELVRRGFTRRVPALLRSLSHGRSISSAR